MGGVGWETKKTRAVPGTEGSCISWRLMPIKFVMKFSIFYSVSREEVPKQRANHITLAKRCLRHSWVTFDHRRKKEPCHLWLFQGTGSSLRMALLGWPLSKDTELRFLLSFQQSLWESLWLVYPRIPQHTHTHKHQISTVFPVKQGVQRWKIMFNTGQLKVEQTANQK